MPLKKSSPLMMDSLTTHSNSLVGNPSIATTDYGFSTSTKSIESGSYLFFASNSQLPKEVAAAKNEGILPPASRNLRKPELPQSPATNNPRALAYRTSSTPQMLQPPGMNVSNLELGQSSYSLRPHNDGGRTQSEKELYTHHRRPYMPRSRPVRFTTNSPPSETALENDWQEQEVPPGPPVSPELESLLPGTIAPPTSPDPDSKLITNASKYMHANVSTHFFSSNGTFYYAKTETQIDVMDIKGKSYKFKIEKRDFAKRVIYDGEFQQGGFSGIWTKYDDINDFTVIFKIENNIITKIESTTQESRLDISPENQKKFAGF